MHIQSKSMTMDRRVGAMAQYGFTLIEIMVAMVLGLVILGVIGQVFITSRTTSMLQEGLARVQESGRFGMEALSYDIRMAGYAGCRSDLTLGTPSGPPGNPSCPDGTICSVANGAGSLPVVFDGIGLKGYRYTGTPPSNNLSDWTPPLPDEFFSTTSAPLAPRLPNAGTDVIVIYRASDVVTHLTGGPTNAQLKVFDTTELYQSLDQAGGDIVLVADCKGADVFKTNALSAGGSGNTGGNTWRTISVSNSANTAPQITHTYGSDAQLFKLISRAYYIANNPNQVPSLYRKELMPLSGTTSVVPQELVEGVEDMRALYWTGTSFQTADQVNAAAAWPNVTTVRVGLLVRTPSSAGAGPDTQVYSLDGISFGPAPNDIFRRKVFTLAVQRRN